MVNEFDVMRQLTDPKLSEKARANLISSQPKLHSEYTALKEAGLTDEKIRIYFQADLTQWGSEFFIKHFGKAWSDTHLTPKELIKFDEAGKKIYAKNGLMGAKAEDKDDVQIMCDGSIYVLTEEIRLNLAERGVVFGGAYGGDNDAYKVLLQERKGITKQVHEAQRIKAYNDLPKTKLRMYDNEVPKDVYDAVEASGAIYKETKEKTYREAAEVDPHASIAQKISSGWLGQLKFFKSAFVTNDFLKRAIHATKTTKDLHYVFKEIDRISADLSIAMKADGFNFVDAARYQFTEAKEMMMKAGGLSFKVKEHMKAELREKIAKKDIQGLMKLAPDMVMVSDFVYADAGVHICRDVEMDAYLKGHELTERGFLNAGNYLPLAGGLPEVPTEEWLKKHTATVEQYIPSPEEWLRKNQIKK